MLEHDAQRLNEKVKKGSLQGPEEKKGHPRYQGIPGMFKVPFLSGKLGIFYDRADNYSDFIKNENTDLLRFLFKKSYFKIKSITDDYKMLEG